jgi:DNA adenine methylase
MVRKGGVEPPKPCGYRILSPARLPVPPLSRAAQVVLYISILGVRVSDSGLLKSNTAREAQTSPDAGRSPICGGTTSQTATNGGSSADDASIRAVQAQLKQGAKRALCAPPAVPFLKWAGGKRQLLPQLRRFVPERFSAYFEPFLGSGALFFDLAARDRLNGIPVTLIDRNADLVGAYTTLAREPREVVARLRELAARHTLEKDALYYEVRDRRFNPERSAWRRNGDVGTYPAALAAQLMYLNRTGFNGLFRLNSKGDFNVPVGRYANPRICDEENLITVAALLQTPQLTVLHDTYEYVATEAKPGDFLYFDPPYAPVSDTSHFRSYTADGFSDDDQQRLQRLVIGLAGRGCSVLLSNSTARQIEDLYDSNAEARSVGLVAHRVPARRAINCDGSSRGFVEEYLVSNVRPS